MLIGLFMTAGINFNIAQPSQSSLYTQHFNTPLAISVFVSAFALFCGLRGRRKLCSTGSLMYICLLLFSPPWGWVRQPNDSFVSHHPLWHYPIFDLYTTALIMILAVLGQHLISIKPRRLDK